MNKDITFAHYYFSSKQISNFSLIPSFASTKLHNAYGPSEDTRQMPKTNKPMDIKSKVINKQTRIFTRNAQWQSFNSIGLKHKFPHKALHSTAVIARELITKILSYSLTSATQHLYMINVPVPS